MCVLLVHSLKAGTDNMEESILENRLTDPELEQFIVATVQLTGEFLGAGAYGSVEEVGIPGARVAAKKLHPQLVNLGSFEQVDKWVTDFIGECKLMSQLRHPNIVQFLGVCYLPGSQLPVLLMEKLQTSLDSLLETSPNIPIDLKVHLLTGTCQGVVYLHSRNPPIAHRDITARNILIDNALNAKIADLGVARMVSIQPGQLLATMTNAPGNNLYMPPEAIQEDGAARYNTTIDVFSFGVVALFTLTQIFPKNIKPASYFDPETQRVSGRTEIERRELYIEPLKSALGDTHPLVQLTLGCLEYLPSSRPSALEVLRRLEEFELAMTKQNCTKTKLELIKQLTNSEHEIDHLQREVTDMQKMLSRNDVHANQLQASVERLQAEKQNLVRSFEERTCVQQKQIDVQREDIIRLSKQIQSLEVLRKEDKVPLNSMISSVITFNWRRFSNKPPGISVTSQPVAHNGKLYICAYSTHTSPLTVLEYLLDTSMWKELAPPSVQEFTMAILKGQLLVVGGEEILTGKTTDSILEFDEKARKWIPINPALPVPLYLPSAVGYDSHLIVAGGYNSTNSRVLNVHTLNMNSYKWSSTEPLPSTDCCNMVIIDDSVYLIGQETRTVLRAQLSNVTSGVTSGVWETLSNVPFYYSSPIVHGNTLLTVGGRDSNDWGGNATTKIHRYDAAGNQWIKVGDLPEPMYYCYCTAVASELFVLGGFGNQSAYIAELVIS